jgi:O-antigen ligase
MEISRNRSSRRTAKGNVLSNFLNSAAVKWYAFLVFLVFALLMGGASRPDVLSLVILRPIAFLFLGYACLVVSATEMRSIRIPVILLACLAGLMAIQLIPLPPALWSSLPQRAIIYEISKDVGMQDVWRPLSLVPSRTLNSLMALSVPAAAMMLFASLDEDKRRKVPLVFILMGAASMLFGLLQVAGPDEGPLYTYRVTNNGLMTGFFANRNHQAVFLACLTPLIIGTLFDRLSSKRAGRVDQNFLLIALAVGMVFLLFPYILVTGSRAGSLLAIVALLLSAMMWLLWLVTEKRLAAISADAQPMRRTSRRKFSGNIALVPVISLIILLGAMSVMYFDRDLALNRYQQISDVEELRSQTFPILFEMAKSHFVFGAGFGSFEWLYRMWEPDHLLMTSYLNQAHNDPMQLIIEGGLPAIAIFCIFGWKLLLRGVAIGRTINKPRHTHYSTIAALFVMAIILAASLADYPLRTPFIMCFFAILLCIFLTPPASVRTTAD